MKSRGPRSTSFYLHAANQLRAPCELAYRLIDLQRALQAIGPEMATQYRISHIKSGALVVTADSGAAAAKLRQSAPAVLAKLQRHGDLPDIARIEVRVRLRFDEPARRKRAVISGEGLNQLERYAANLDEMPLKAALTALIARQRGRR